MIGHREVEPTRCASLPGELGVGAPLAPRYAVASQFEGVNARSSRLLLGYELQRGCESMTEDAFRDDLKPFGAWQESRETLEDAFRAVPEGINALPSFIQDGTAFSSATM